MPRPDPELHDHLDDDGYPTEGTLKAIEEWSHQEGWKALLDWVCELWHYGDWGWEVRKDEMDYGSVIAKRRSYILRTGGWSGNEDIIYALSRNFVFYGSCWRGSARGGSHVYEVDETIVKTGEQ